MLSSITGAVGKIKDPSAEAGKRTVF